MSQYKDIPQPQDQRNVSQNDILTNYRYLSTPLNVAAGTPNGILPVDHLASGDNVANPTDGFHKQVSMLNIATPASLTNAINSQASASITYTKNDGNGNGQLRMLNSFNDQPVTYLKLACRFDAAGNLLGNNFNCFSVTRNGAGDFRIRFTTNMPNTDYLVFVEGSPGNVTAVYYAYNYAFKLVNRFDVNIAQVTSSTVTPIDPVETSVMVYGFF